MDIKPYSQTYSQLHKALSYLIADIAEDTGLLLNQVSTIQLVRWSYRQVIAEEGRVANDKTSSHAYTKNLSS
jgi:hypothetical protein